MRIDKTGGGKKREGQRKDRQTRHDTRKAIRKQLRVRRGV